MTDLLLCTSAPSSSLSRLDPTGSSSIITFCNARNARPNGKTFLSLRSPSCSETRSSEEKREAHHHESKTREIGVKKEKGEQESCSTRVYRSTPKKLPAFAKLVSRPLSAQLSLSLTHHLSPSCSLSMISLFSSPA